MKRSLGVCYYPEHWPEAQWPEDAARMAAAGLSWVRIDEFAWSRVEPEPGRLRLDWLDRAIDVLGDAGLKVVLNVVLGTPTATPPRWMLDRHPDMLAVDAAGRPRKFGSRRHYCFSHAGYLAECRRIVTHLAERDGAHGAETVCYFRWRQAPFGQEQMHAGLLRPDGVAAPGLVEAAQVAAELSDAPDVAHDPADVALVFDCESA